MVFGLLEESNDNLIRCTSTWPELREMIMVC